MPAIPATVRTRNTTSQNVPWLIARRAGRRCHGPPSNVLERARLEAPYQGTRVAPPELVQRGHRVAQLPGEVIARGRVPQCSQGETHELAQAASAAPEAFCPGIQVAVEPVILLPDRV